MAKDCTNEAFMRNADCYILDEPSSSLDPISEIETFQTVADFTKGKISILISHRLYNLRRIPSARILVLRNGNLVESGTHEDLINAKGYYEHLYSLQNTLDLDEMKISCVS